MALCGIFFNPDQLNFGKISLDKHNSKDNSDRSTVMLQLSPIDSGINICSISCGKEHVIMLSQHGAVYSYGVGR